MNWSPWQCDIPEKDFHNVCGFSHSLNKISAMYHPVKLSSETELSYEFANDILKSQLQYLSCIQSSQ